MKVFLDDVREAPEGWVRVYWPDEAIALLQTGDVTELSLDHDLGDDTRGTGYDVLTWLEQVAFDGTLRMPEISIHSANAVGRQRMAAAIQSIHRLVEARGGK